MSIQVPSVADINANLIAQLEGALSQTIPLLPKAFSRVLAKALAAVVALLYRYCGFIFLQLFVAHASMEWTKINGKLVRPLVEWGRLIGIGDPEPATRAELIVEVNVENQIGQLPAGSKLLRSNTGIIYQVLAAVDLDAAVVQARVRAFADQQGGLGEGAIGNLETGDTVSFVTPLPNVKRDVTVVSQVTTGADGESVDAYRKRIFQRFQSKPQGGAYADYRLWAQEVEGIINAYPYAGLGGEVDVYCEATEASSGSEDGIPTTPQLDAVLASINLDVAGNATRRPVNAMVNVLPITRVGFAVQISGLNPETVETQDAIAEGVDEYFRSREPFIVGLSVLPRNDRITAAAVSGIVDGIADAHGATITTVELTPGPAYTLGPGEKAKASGPPTYV